MIYHTIIFKKKDDKVLPFQENWHHLILILSLKDNNCKLIIDNSTILLSLNDISLASSKIKSVSLFKKLFGEVSSVVIYSYPNIIDSESEIFQEEKQKDFNLYSNSFNNPEVYTKYCSCLFPKYEGRK